jgi:CRP-like cAMP-binding protein
MSIWESNQYYLLKKTDKKTIQTSNDLLNSYPLTRGCLETLGQDLKDQLEFGFFEKETDIIIQGESGRDIFLLCSGTIDVLVGGQVVVQMKSPSLVGDKGIISDNSERAATIKISSDHPALVIKIPMGSFIRDFKDNSISDESFNQEKKVFENVFQTVQERLFEFIYLQKSLWEQASNAIQLINQQIYAKQLDNQIDPNWNHDAWQVAQTYVKSKTGMDWPRQVPINAKNLHSYLRRYLDHKYKNATDQKLIIRKKLEWRNTLTEIATRVTKSLPDDKKPIPPLDLELFNPNIYRMRLIGLQNQLQKKFDSRLISKGAIKKTPSASFYGKGERSNEFNLPLYLEFFYKMYKVNNPRRLLAQVGQKCALVAADCENNFNSSVVKMQKFLEEVKSRNISLVETGKKSKVDPGLIRSNILTLIRGIHHYRDSSPSIDGQTLGQIKFSENTFPNYNNMVKAHRAQLTRDKMAQAFRSLIKISQFQTEYLSKQILDNLFHLCGVEKGDTINESELRDQYWFPLTGHLTLKQGDNVLISLNSCSPIGGENWNSRIDEEKKENEGQLSLLAEEDTIMMVVSNSKLPWERFANPDNNTFIEQHLPLMQWYIDKCIDFLLDLQTKRDVVVDEWTEIRNGIHRSEKIAVFEQKALKLPTTDYQRIAGWLNSTLGLKLDANEILVSNKLSKRIYNFFLHSATVDFPEMSIEQRGNQAYTRWRNLLFELTEQIPVLNKVVSKLPGDDPRPVLDMLAEQLTPHVSEFIKERWEKQNPITSGKPNLNLLPILHPDNHESPEDSNRLFLQILDVFSINIFQLVQEIKKHKETLRTLFDQRSQADSGSGVSTEYADMRQESIKNLLKLLTPPEN